MELCETRPLVGVVARLTQQKGIHLIKHACWRALERGGQFVLLGSSPDGNVQSDFNAMASTSADSTRAERLRVCLRRTVIAPGVRRVGHAPGALDV